MNGVPDRVVIDKSGANLAGLQSVNVILKFTGTGRIVTIRQVKYLDICDTTLTFHNLTQQSLSRRFRRDFHASNASSRWSRMVRWDRRRALRREHTEERPHSAIGNNVPAALMKLPDASGPSV